MGSYWESLGVSLGVSLGASLGFLEFVWGKTNNETVVLGRSLLGLAFWLEAGVAGR